MSASGERMPKITDLAQLIQPRTVEATESAARLVLAAGAEPGLVVALRGEISGPYSRWARTLPATFPLTLVAATDGATTIAEAVVPDPCYWSPALAHTYRLDAEAEFADGSRRELRAQIGLERWGADGANLRREGQRVVLRAAAATGSHAELEAARDAEMALVVTAPSDEFCAEASELGVAIVADLRGRSFADYVQPLRAVAWRPAVVAVLADHRAPPRLPHALPPRVAARVLRTADWPFIHLWSPWLNVIAVELDAGEPLTWNPFLKGRPVIAIRRGVSYADLHEARAACDQLQAGLAPEFNLAGYFVAPD